MAPIFGDGTADRNDWQTKRTAWDYLADDRIRIAAELLLIAGLLVVWASL